MELFLEVLEDKVIVSATVMTEEYIGDVRREIRAGESFGSLTYEVLRQHGSGRMEIEVPTGNG